jgi:hypothetical protein
VAAPTITEAYSTEASEGVVVAESTYAPVVTGFVTPPPVNAASSAAGVIVNAGNASAPATAAIQTYVPFTGSASYIVSGVWSIAAGMAAPFLALLL